MEKIKDETSKSLKKNKKESDAQNVVQHREERWDESRRRLIQAAFSARKHAYAPYSRYTVGAALLTAEGDIFQGGNIENASYGATNCAERTAIFKAVSEGRRSFRAIAIAGGMEESEPVEYAYPCGICRQVMQEFADENFVIIVAKSVTDYREYRLKDLLPYGFGGESIQ